MKLGRFPKIGFGFVRKCGFDRTLKVEIIKGFLYAANPSVSNKVVNLNR